MKYLIENSSIIKSSIKPDASVENYETNISHGCVSVFQEKPQITDTKRVRRTEKKELAERQSRAKRSMVANR